MLYELGLSGGLAPVPETTFAEAGVWERRDLQAAVRDHIGVLGDDLKVVAEEFDRFEGSRRRIDLLCVDRQLCLVVVELKRTADGGHMELQALRYAAMVAGMPFDDLCAALARHRRAVDGGEFTVERARAELLEWWEDEGDEEPVIGRDVRVILVSADFGQEVTTAVLWLNEVYGTDIRCVRLSPYRHGDSVLLDVQHIIPLPEAEDFLIQARQHSDAVRTASGRDRTRYLIEFEGRSEGPLNKRRAVLAMVGAVHAAGADPERVRGAVGEGKFRSVAVPEPGQELWEAFAERHGLSREQRSRWFHEDPLADGDRVWVLSNQWGTDTEDVLRALAALAPGNGGPAFRAV